MCRMVRGRPICKSLALVLLLAGEEEFERSRVVLEKSVVLRWVLCVEFAWSGCDGRVACTADAEY